MGANASCSTPTCCNKEEIEFDSIPRSPSYAKQEQEATEGEVQVSFKASLSSAIIAGASPADASTSPGSAVVSPHSPKTPGTLKAQDFNLHVDQLLSFCKEGRIFDAAEALQTLELSMAAEPADSKAVVDIRSRLQNEAVLTVLRVMHARMMQSLSSVGPRSLPQGESDRRWATIQVADPLIDPAFRADFYIRFAEGAERDPHGPSTQELICCNIFNFPMDVVRFASVYRETDLYQKEWIVDCEKCEGQVGGQEKLYSAVSYVINSSPILPVRLEVITVREFSVCDTAPLDGQGPGVLVMDCSPTGDESEFAGWELPPKLRKAVRLSANLVLYIKPTPGKPGYSDCFAVAKVGAPIPQWLVPQSLIKRFMAKHFVSVFQAYKLHIGDHWDELQYKNRIATCTDFYDPIIKIAEAVGNPGAAAEAPSKA